MRIKQTLARLLSRATDASARYGWGVLLLLLIGLASELLGSMYLTPDSVPRSLAQGTGDALLITGILALLVDPYLKGRIQRESGWSAVFGYLNPNAPEGLRNAVKDLAACKRYYTRAAWKITFEWQDRAKRVVAVTMEVTYTGINISQSVHSRGRLSWAFEAG